MTNAELLAKIKAEIKGWLREYAEDSQFELGERYGYKRLLSFLSTIESEKPSGPTLEEPIDGVLYAAACGIKNAAGKSEKPIEQDGLEKEAVNYCFDNGLNLSPRVATDFARHFAKWGAEHANK